MKTKIILLLCLLMLSIAPSIEAQDTTNVSIHKLPRLENLKRHNILSYWERNYVYDWSKQDQMIYNAIKNNNLWRYGNGTRWILDEVIYVKKPWLKTQDTIFFSDINDCIDTNRTSNSHRSAREIAREMKQLNKDWEKRNKMNKKFFTWCDSVYQKFDAAYTTYMGQPTYLFKDSIFSQVFIGNLQLMKPKLDSIFYQELPNWKGKKEWVEGRCWELDGLTMTMTRDKYVTDMPEEELAHYVNIAFEMIDLFITDKE